MASELTPPELSSVQWTTIFDHFLQKLALHCNNAELYARAEYNTSNLPDTRRRHRREAFLRELRTWSTDLLQTAWLVCNKPGGGDTCPQVNSIAPSAQRHLPELPSDEIMSKVLNYVLFLNITSQKSYSARTRAFISTAFHTFNEDVIVSTLKHPERAIQETQRKAEQTTQVHASKSKWMRNVGMGFGAVAGGVLIGVTGGLAAPLVGAGVSTILGIVGVGGTAAGLLASGLAGSSIVCGALFGVDGARTTASMVERHSREIRDLAVVPVHKPKPSSRQAQVQETLAVRLCVSGWLNDLSDVTEPFTVYGGDDTYALRWEVEALKELSTAFGEMLRTKAIKYVQATAIKMVLFASLMSALAPMAVLTIGQIIDNPWMNAKAYAVRAGAVLGDLLAARAFGNRPISLTGYSLGGLVIFEALKHLVTLPAALTAHLVQDVFLFGIPTSTEPSTWASIRRVVAGRLINGYAVDDYILAVLSRASSSSWAIAGLSPVEVRGVENLKCVEVDSHMKWRGMIGKCLLDCGAPGVQEDEVDKQMREVAKPIEIAMHLTPEQEREWHEKGFQAEEKVSPPVAEDIGQPGTRPSDAKPLPLVSSPPAQAPATVPKPDFEPVQLHVASLTLHEEDSEEEGWKFPGVQQKSTPPIRMLRDDDEEDEWEARKFPGTSMSSNPALLHEPLVLDGGPQSVSFDNAESDDEWAMGVEGAFGGKPMKSVSPLRGEVPDPLLLDRTFPPSKPMARTVVSESEAPVAAKVVYTDPLRS